MPANTLKTLARIVWSGPFRKVHIYDRSEFLRKRRREKNSYEPLSADRRRSTSCHILQSVRFPHCSVLGPYSPVKKVFFECAKQLLYAKLVGGNAMIIAEKDIITVLHKWSNGLEWSLFLWWIPGISAKKTKQKSASSNKFHSTFPPGGTSVLFLGGG